MPYASDAQRKKFHVLENEGKISHKTVAEFDQASKGLSLPDHVKKHGNSAGYLHHLYKQGRKKK